MGIERQPKVDYIGKVQTGIIIVMREQPKSAVVLQFPKAAGLDTYDRVGDEEDVEIAPWDAEELNEEYRLLFETMGVVLDR